MGRLTLALLVAGCAGHPLRGADPAVPVALPADDAAHDDAQTEWWHFHGHVRDEQGRAYDFFAGFVRQHTDVDRLAGFPVRWFSDPFQVAYVTVTDRAAGTFHVRDKVAWPDFWAASASTDRLALRHDSWRAAASPEDPGLVRLSAGTRRTRLDLSMRGTKPPTPMGRGGFLPFPPRSDHYYVSSPRMQVEGTLVVDGEPRAVHGAGWMKHEWGFLYTDHLAGWVWHGVQLSNGRELVVALVFDLDWQLAEGSFAAVVEPDGSASMLDVRSVDVRQTGETWRSPQTDTVYPVGWAIEVPSRRAALMLEAPVPGQEMVVMPANLWAGALTVTGTFEGQPVTGDCFTEIVGIDEPFGRALLASGRP